MMTMKFSKQVLIFALLNFIKPFWTITLILYSLKTPEDFWFPAETFWFPGVFKGYKMGTLTRNELI